jgi:hypothetical protein
MLTEEQKKARLGKMTSSVLCAALGLHEKASPLDAYLAITEGKNIPETKPLQRGNLLEPVVLEYPTVYRGEPWRWDKAQFRAHPARPWSADSADAVYWRDGQVSIEAIGEGKTVAGTVADEYGIEGTDQVARPTLIQSHWHLDHWPEVDECLVPVLVGGFRFEFRLYVVRRDANFEGMLVEEAERFMRDYVEPKVLPPATALDLEYLRRVHKVAIGEKWIADTTDIKEWAHRKAQARLARLDSEKEEAEADARLVQLLGDAEGVKAEWGKVGFKNERNEVTTDFIEVARAVALRNKVSADDFNKVVAKFTAKRTIEETDWKSVANVLGAHKQDISDHTLIKYGPRVLRVTVDALKPKKAKKSNNQAADAAQGE